MSARTSVDRQRLRETHELQLLNQAGQPQPRGRGQGQPVAKPPSSSSVSATGPPMSQKPSQNGFGEAAYNLLEVPYFFKCFLLHVSIDGYQGRWEGRNLYLDLTELR